MRLRALLLALLPLLGSCEREPEYDLLVRGGTVYDGTGSAGYAGEVAIQGDRIAYVGPKAPGRARREIDATGQAVAPGFINMLSWSTESLLVDGRGQGELRQGVTLQVMGEGDSMGPLTPPMKEDLVAQQGDLKYPVEWTTLGEYLALLEKKGVSMNVASLVGAATARIMQLGVGGRRTRRPSSSRRCRTSCGRRWRRARSASAPRSSTCRPPSPRPTSWSRSRRRRRAAAAST